MHYAHEQGVLHRDLKPSNVLIDGHDLPRITDFGLARSLSTDARLTLSGQMLGTPQYMPPEQASVHQGEVGPWSDVYSIGGILYHLLTGRPPFVGGQVGDVLQQVLQYAPVAPRLLNPGVPRDLETIALKCLEKDPQRRYATARELAEELGRCLDHRPIRARPAGPMVKTWRWCRRRPLVAGLCLALAIALATGVSGVTWQWRRAAASGLLARRNAYAGDMMLVQQSLEEDDFGQARSLLDRQRPPRDQPDLRGWEWRYRWSQSQPDVALQRSLYQHTCAVNHIVVAPDGKWLAFSAVDGTVATLELDSGPAKVLQSSNMGPAVVAMAPHGNLLAFTECTGWPSLDSVSAAQVQGRLRLWDVAAAREVLAFEYQGHVVALAFTPNGRSLAALAIDPTWTKEVVTLWDIAQPSRVTTHVIASTRTLTFEEAMAMSPRGDVVAIGDAAGRIHILGLTTLNQQLVFPAHDEMVTALAFSPNGQMLASGAGYSDPSVRLWNPATGERITAPLTGHRRFVRGLTFSPDGQTLSLRQRRPVDSLVESIRRRVHFCPARPRAGSLGGGLPAGWNRTGECLQGWFSLALEFVRSTSRADSRVDGRRCLAILIYAGR